MDNIFKIEITTKFIERINHLSNSSQSKWGEMSVEQMLAHCNVTYSMIYDEDRQKPVRGFKKFILKILIKPIVVSEKPYKNNGRTAPEFIISSKKYFDKEKNILVSNLNRTQKLGADHFDGKASNSFGPLTAKQWSNMFVKHLDHHLKQFGV